MPTPMRPARRYTGMLPVVGILRVVLALPVAFQSNTCLASGASPQFLSLADQLHDADQFT